MQNDIGEYVDMYIPRKCSVTNQIISSKDYPSVQMNVGRVNEDGNFTGETDRFLLCGRIRGMGESDDSINRLCNRINILPKNFSTANQFGQ